MYISTMYLRKQIEECERAESHEETTNTVFNST